MKSTLWNKSWTVYSDTDSTKKAVDLPHDAMREEKRIPGLKDGTQTAFYPGGIYTYEKTLDIASEDVDKKTVLEFEGIYMKSSVYLNGERLGGRIYGYSDFFVDLTGKLKAGKNDVKVVADNSQCANSRWYSGSGIYRDVWLHTSGAARIFPDGIKVTTLSLSPAKVRVETRAELPAGETVKVRIEKDGMTVAEGQGTDIELSVADAKLWSAETPELYDVFAEVVKNGEVLDSEADTFGIRMITWDSQNGFQVNGKTVNLRGGCVHHDHGVIGAVEYDAACLRRVRIMKEAGFNAVRISHHPASKAMLRACDKVGLYVMNESFDTWFGLKSPYDYAMYFSQESSKDLADMIRVSYNHPSVIMYSIGNEVHMKEIDRAAEIGERLAKQCHELDTTRPVVNALNPLMAIMGGDKDPEAPKNDKVDPRAEGEASGLTGSQLANVLLTQMDNLMKVFGNEGAMKKRNKIMEPLDIVGYNYATYLYKKQHKDYPARVLVGSESFPKKVYENWQMVKEMPWVTGDFLWTGWDYLGECGCGMPHYGKAGSFIQPYPTISAGCGNINLSGEITAQGYYSAIVYGEYENPYIAVHPLPHHGEKCFTGRWSLTDAVRSWDWPGYEGKMATVDVYTGAASVELFVNGTSYGKRAAKECIATWEVPYHGGELKAVQYDASGKATGTDLLTAPTDTRKLNLVADKSNLAADGQDLVFVTVEISDEKGVRRTAADGKVALDVKGPATLLGYGSASIRQDDFKPYLGTETETFEGHALAVLRSAGEAGTVSVTASANGMDPVTLTIEVA